MTTPREQLIKNIIYKIKQLQLKDPLIHWYIYLSDVLEELLPDNQPEECHHDFERQEGLGDRCEKCGIPRPQGVSKKKIEDVVYCTKEQCKPTKKIELETMTINNDFVNAIDMFAIKRNIQKIADRLNEID